MTGEINLISTYSDRAVMSGPRKVFLNLTKGLSRIGQPFCVNQALTSTRRLWIHSDLHALLELPRWRTLNLLGPNLVHLPRDIPGRRDFPCSYYVHPSNWVVQLWQQEGFRGCPLRAWPVGIDTDEFTERQPPPPGAPVLIYYKERSPLELAAVERKLEERGTGFHTVRYGAYQQRDYIRLLQTHAYVIWLAGPETQGIALQETLAMNVPVLVLNAGSLFDAHLVARERFSLRLRHFRATSVPYFDSRCGMIVDHWGRLNSALDRMQDGWHDFCPREFVRENLSLERQASQFSAMFDELETQYGSAVRSLPDRRRDKPYQPTTLSRIRVRARQVITRYSRRSWILFERKMSAFSPYALLRGEAGDSAF